MLLQTSHFTLRDDRVQLVDRQFTLSVTLRQLLVLVYTERQISTATLAAALGIAPGRANTLTVAKQRLAKLFGFEVIVVVRGVYRVPDQIQIRELDTVSHESVAVELAALNRKTDEILKHVRELAVWLHGHKRPALAAVGIFAIGGAVTLLTEPAVEPAEACLYVSSVYSDIYHPVQSAYAQQIQPTNRVCFADAAAARAAGLRTAGTTQPEKVDQH